MTISVLQEPSVERQAELTAFMYENKFNLKLHSAEEINNFFKSPDEIKYFCWKQGLYQLPTKELIDFIKQETKDVLPSEMLEIGAGAGQIGSHLGIRMTDNKLQDDPAISALYNIARQPQVTYHPDIERLDGNLAVHKYQPRVVIACWVTEFPRLLYGIDEHRIISQVEKYIFVGNIKTHFDKPCLKDRDGIYEEWIISRGAQKYNRIWIIQ